MADMQRVGRLLAAYWEAANQRGPHLEEFTRNVAEGKWEEPVPPAEIRLFLETVRERIIDNIETKAQEGGPWAMMKDQAIADTDEEIDGLISRYAEP